MKERDATVGSILRLKRDDYLNRANDWGQDFVEAGEQFRVVNRHNDYGTYRTYIVHLRPKTKDSDAATHYITDHTNFELVGSKISSARDQMQNLPDDSHRKTDYFVYNDELVETQKQLKEHRDTAAALEEHTQTLTAAMDEIRQHSSDHTYLISKIKKQLEQGSLEDAGETTQSLLDLLTPTAGDGATDPADPLAPASTVVQTTTTSS